MPEQLQLLLDFENRNFCLIRMHLQKREKRRSTTFNRGIRYLYNDHVTRKVFVQNDGHKTVENGEKTVDFNVWLLTVEAAAAAATLLKHHFGHEKQLYTPIQARGVDL